MRDSDEPDWKAIVRERIGDMRIAADQQTEVICELAGHLKEVYEGLLVKGICKSEALERSLSEINWRQLSQRIQSAKREGVYMNSRTKQFWLPALVSLAISEGVLLIISLTVANNIRISMMGPKVTYIPWLISLPIAGAVAAYLSRRAGSGRRILLAASLFPAGMGLSFVVTGIAITLTTGVRIFAQPQWLYASRALGVGVLVPAMALLLGAAPFVTRNSAKA